MAEEEIPHETIELRRFVLEVASRLKFFETSNDDGVVVTTEKSITAAEVVAAARNFESFIRNG